MGALHNCKIAQHCGLTVIYSADFAQYAKIICIYQKFFVTLHAVCVQGKKTIAK
jgi:hypothetical protein